MDICIFKIVEKTSVEGPGIRFCIWVQGCSRHCKGCQAKHTWDKNKGEIFSTEEIFEKIKAQKNIEGVTFLGGEPFEQAGALAEIAEQCQKIGLSVLTFTGNTYEELLKFNDNEVNKLLKYTDLLIDGAFEEDKLDYSRAWVGSQNQRYIFLTNRYSIKDVEKVKNKFEIRFEKNGKLFINGMGDLERLTRDLALLKE